jgi:hypothetical protein
MSAFEYAMVLISIVVGLAITHILAGLGSAVQRLRGGGPPIRLEGTYLSWVAVIFVWLVFFWWWEFKWSELAPEFGLGLFLFLVLYAVSLFLLSVVLVPHRLAGVADSWEYFLSIRPWFYGGLLLVNAIDLADSFMKGVAWGSRWSGLAYWAAVTSAGVIGLTTTRRAVHTGLAITLLIWNVLLTFYENAILGAW